MQVFALIAALALGQTGNGDIASVEAIEGAPIGHVNVDVSLGGSWMEDILGQELDADIFGSIGIGYGLNLTDTGELSFELEFAQHNGGADGSFNIGGDYGKGYGYNVAWDGDVESNVFMLNVMWAQTLGSDDHNGIGPYLGFGVGYADNEGTLDVSVTSLYHDSKKTKHVSVSDSGFAWQVFGGVFFRFNENSKIYLGGRYADLGDLYEPLSLEVESLVIEFGYTHSF